MFENAVKKAFTVDATYTQYHIYGVDPSGKATGVFQSDDGYVATVHADQGLLSQKTYSDIWTKTTGGIRRWADCFFGTFMEMNTPRLVGVNLEDIYL